MRSALPLAAIVVAGLVGVAVFGVASLSDWAALQAAYAQFDRVARGSTELPALFVADARQSIHRINLLADGVWTLLSANLAAIGIHGLCLRAHQRTGTS